MDVKLQCKKILMKTLILCMICVIMFATSITIKNKTQAISDTATQSHAFANRLSELNLQIAQKETLLQESNISTSAESNDEYMVSLGALAKTLEVNITKIQSEQSETINGITTTLNTIEVQGSLEKLEAFQKNITKGRFAEISNLSLRQNNELLWLARDFDKTKVLPWLEFKKVETAIIAEDESTEAPTDMSQLFNQSDMLCYFEVKYYS